LILAAYTQLRLACGIVADRRLPWEKPLSQKRLTPTRVLGVLGLIRATVVGDGEPRAPDHGGP